jgi:DNA-binding NtrC family response regulator
MDHTVSDRKPLTLTSTHERSKRKPPAIERDLTFVSILSVSSTGADHEALERILRRDRWTVHPVRTVSAAMSVLAKNRLPIVICESDVAGVSWKAVLEQLRLLGDSPSVLVSSRLADEHLWVEALNLGAYDVLSKPFDRAELTRILDSAWLDWRDRHEAAGRPLVRVAAG